MLLNAISAGRIRGVQFKRGWSKEQETFEDLNKVIVNRIDGALQVAGQEGFSKTARGEERAAVVAYLREQGWLCLAKEIEDANHIF